MLQGYLKQTHGNYSWVVKEDDLMWLLNVARDQITADLNNTTIPSLHDEFKRYLDKIDAALNEIENQD